ncbi:MAG: putative quinol monooxygenase [Nitrosopumilus sp.]
MFRRIEKYLKEILPDTRSFEGCLGAQLFENKESPTKMIIHSKWTSEEADKKYMAWRTETGVFDEVAPMLTGPLSTEFYNVLDD